MTELENVALFVVFGCVIGFPVMAVACWFQHREIVRLNGMLERCGAVAEKCEEPEERKAPVPNAGSYMYASFPAGRAFRSKRRR